MSTRLTDEAPNGHDCDDYADESNEDLRMHMKKKCPVFPPEDAPAYGEVSSRRFLGLEQKISFIVGVQGELKKHNCG